MKDIDMTGIKLPSAELKKLFEINKQEWLAELEDQKRFFEIFGKDLPKEIMHEHKALEKRIKKEL
jgi:GTP-dependent phosphoenolpyruvate carboxykinase